MASCRPSGSSIDNERLVEEVNQSLEQHNGYAIVEKRLSEDQHVNGIGVGHSHIVQYTEDGDWVDGRNEGSECQRLNEWNARTCHAEEAQEAATLAYNQCG